MVHLIVYSTFNISEKEDYLEFSIKIWKDSVVTGPTWLVGQGQGWQKLGDEYSLHSTIQVIVNTKDEANFFFMLINLNTYLFPSKRILLFILNGN